MTQTKCCKQQVDGDRFESWKYCPFCGCNFEIENVDDNHRTKQE